MLLCLYKIFSYATAVFPKATATKNALLSLADFAKIFPKNASARKLLKHKYTWHLRVEKLQKQIPRTSIQCKNSDKDYNIPSCNNN
jgi:hypothetical protein